MDMYTTQRQVGYQAAFANRLHSPPIPKSQAKKRATEVAQNALRAHYIQKELRLTLMRILPDKKSEPCEKQNHEADCQHPCDHHVVEKHDGSPALALLR